MAVTSTPEEDPLKPVNTGDAAQGCDGPEPANGDGEVGEEVESTEGSIEVDFEAIESVVERNDDASLVAGKIIPAEHGYTIEDLQNGDSTAWNKASERFLKIAVYKYRDVVQFYLPGVGEDDAISATGEIIVDLCKSISKYPSLPQLEAAFRKALRNDIRSLQRKYLTQKRGEGKIDVSSELHGLGHQDAPVDQGSYKDEDEISPSPKNTSKTLEDEVNWDFGGWGSLQTVDASAAANTVDLKKLMSVAMDELKLAERQMIELSVIGGLKQREVAERLNKNPKQIGIELNRAKKKLKKLVGEKMLIEKKTLL
jgi:RNA polymerase sigma factor (sigma-70 family)